MKKDSLIDKRYRIDNVIGRGGTSVIYKAHDIKGGRICAVKQSGDDISREARLLRELNHPRIPSIWDVVEENGYTYMIMDYKPGRTLLDIAQSKGPQRAEDVVWWMIQLVQVIGYLHSRIPEIIYRDVKPSNIILGDDNTINLVDFGAAKKYNSRASKDRIYIGTAGYAAPEQFGGKGQTDLAVEAGAKTGIVEPDEKVEEFIKEHGRRADNMYVSDEDAKFLKVYEYDLDKIEPVVARPDFVDDVIPLSQVGDVKIDEAFLGSCNNGRIDDLRVAAEILKGRKVNPDVRFLIAPASNNVYIQALDEGLIDIFMESGAMVMNANCSVCWGSCQGVIGENEVLISTGTRNFKGRAGHKTSKVYLGSAATVTASAIAGKICGPDEL